ncbi:MAG: caspase family protein, partial [Roseovarius sp.]
MRVLLSWVLLTLACALPAPASAETRALLIGVSDYDETIGLADLRGPANDVRLLADTLRGRGITDIALLADGLEGAARPTRAAILEAFSTLARTAQPGDFIYIHMSGHGTRQSDPEGDETDALDEVFLPADTARAEAGSNAIPNAIVDDEIGRALAAIRRTGADVWLVLDSCHSGSGTRAGSPRTAVRFVDPALLGIVAPVKPRAEAAVLDPTPEDLPGGFLAFYSAQSNELAREVDFGTGEGGEAWYGLFTAKLAARLQSSEGLSFRQLFQAVLSDMNDTTVPGGARLQTPLWEGNLIDAAVFGGRDTAGLRRFALAGDTLQAGLVHGIAEGTLLGLVADPADPAQAVIAHAQAVGVTAREAGLRAVTEACVPRAEAPCEAGPPLPATARFAQVIGQPLDTVIRFAHPRDFASGALLPETDPLAAALRSAVESLSGTAMAPTPDAFDIEVVADAGALWFGAQQSLGTQPTGLSWRPDGTADLAALLTRIAEAETLARVLMNVSESGSLLNPSPITVEALRFSAPIEALATPGAQVSPRSECRQALAT